MLRRRIARRYSDTLMGYFRAYQQQHPGPARMEHVAAWAYQVGLWEPRKVHPVTQLTRDLKQAARESRITDPQGRKLREMLPAKHEGIDNNGNRVFEVVWDHVFAMSTDHGLLFLSQQYANIEKQCRSHSRIKESITENNPNFREVQLSLFNYDFRCATEGGTTQAVEKIAETPVSQTRRTTGDQSGGGIKRAGTIDIVDVNLEITNGVETGRKAASLRKAK